MITKRVAVYVLGSVAVLVIVSLAALLVPWITSRMRESELIEVIKLESPPGESGIGEIIKRREEAVRELGEMGSVRAIPHIIQMWGETGSKDHYAGRKALVAIGKPAIPQLRNVLRGQTEDPTNNRRLMTIITCEEMGPTALPLLPELLEWYRNTSHFREDVVKAIRAIGEKESVNEVSDW